MLLVDMDRYIDIKRLVEEPRIGQDVHCLTNTIHTTKGTYVQTARGDKRANEDFHHHMYVRSWYDKRVNEDFHHHRYVRSWYDKKHKRFEKFFML